MLKHVFYRFSPNIFFHPRSHSNWNSAVRSNADRFGEEAFGADADLRRRDRNGLEADDMEGDSITEACFGTTLGHFSAFVVALCMVGSSSSTLMTSL